MSAPPDNPRSAVQPEPALSWRVRAVERMRRWAALIARHRLRTAVVVCGTGVIATSLLSAAYYVMRQRQPVDPELAVRRGLTCLDAGQWEEARIWAARLWETPDLPRPLRVYPPFVQGAALAQEAESISQQAERRIVYRMAAQYLEEARDRRLPPAREAQGLYLLAIALFRGEEYAASLPALHAALEANRDREYELYSLLSSAYARQVPADFARAVDYQRLTLEDPGLSPAERDGALARLAEYFLELGDGDGCRATLETIGADSPELQQVWLLRGRLALWEAEQFARRIALGEATAKVGRDEACRAAMDWFDRVRELDGVSVSARQASYLAGVCRQQQGDDAAAKEAFERTVKLYYRTDEALAAGLALGELAQREGLVDTALATYLRVLAEIEDPALYRNPWLPLSELRGRLAAARLGFCESDDFAAADALVEAYRAVFPVDDATESLAQTQELWATALKRRAETQTRLLREATQGESREHYRRAADAYRQLAELRFATPNYPDYLLRSGQCYLQSQCFPLAIELMTKYLDHAPRKQAASALLGLGEAHAALGQYGQALAVLEELVHSFPKHPETYRARLLANFAHQELGQFAEAKQQLLDNLHHSELTPRSDLWRQSLFAYGGLIYREALAQEARSRLQGVDASDIDARQAGLRELRIAHDMFGEARGVLEEGAARYPDAEEVIEARYRIAESYRHAAKLPEKLLATELTASRRDELEQERRAYLQAAAREYRDVQRLLSGRQRTDLSELEEGVLRNACFARADVLSSLEEYDAAIDAYQIFTNQYRHAPESLEAFVRMADCYRRLQQPAEARGVLLQAEQVLTQLEDEADFLRTTRFDRDQWRQVLGWLSQL